MGTFWLH